MINRDSAILTVAALGALVTYLISIGEPPTKWDYQQWLQFAAATFAYIMGKLQTSPLKGEND